MHVSHAETVERISLTFGTTGVCHVFFSSCGSTLHENEYSASCSRDSRLWRREVWSIVMPNFRFSFLGLKSLCSALKTEETWTFYQNSRCYVPKIIYICNSFKPLKLDITVLLCSSVDLCTVLISLLLWPSYDYPNNQRSLLMKVTLLTKWITQWRRSVSCEVLITCLYITQMYFVLRK